MVMLYYTTIVSKNENSRITSYYQIHCSVQCYRIEILAFCQTILISVLFFLNHSTHCNQNWNRLGSVWSDRKTARELINIKIS